MMWIFLAVQAFVRGIAAERFCVRNSGVTAVCEVRRALTLNDCLNLLVIYNMALRAQVVEWNQHLRSQTRLLWTAWRMGTHKWWPLLQQDSQCVKLLVNMSCDNKDILSHVFGKQRRLWTAWPCCVILVCRLLFILYKRQIVTSCQDHSQELFWAVFICLFPNLRNFQPESDVCH